MPGRERFLLSDDLVGLRPFAMEDAEAIAEACQDPEIARWTTIPSPYLVEYATAFVDLTAQWREDGSAFHFAIVDRRRGGLSGSIGLDSITEPSAQVGYWVAPWARRRGVATHALRLVTDWAFDSLGLDAIGLATKLGNDTSERVARSAGYLFLREETDQGPPDAHFTVKRWVRTKP